MGRQARLKKIRRDPEPQPQGQTGSESTQFVKELRRQGYNLQQIERSPDLPNDNPEPEV